MLIRIELCFDHQRFVRGVTAVDFVQGVNAVVGPNGSGKSSLLKAIYSCSACRKVEDGPTRYHYYNGELMNPHRSDMTAPSLLRARAMFSSHGETMRDVLAFIPLSMGDTLLLDEPESGQDIEWVLRINRGFRSIVRRGCQLIIATHNPAFLRNQHVFELQRGYRKKIVALSRALVR